MANKDSDTAQALLRIKAAEDLLKKINDITKTTEQKMKNIQEHLDKSIESYADIINKMKQVEEAKVSLAKKSEILNKLEQEYRDQEDKDSQGAQALFKEINKLKAEKVRLQKESTKTFKEELENTEKMINFHEDELELIKEKFELEEKQRKATEEFQKKQEAALDTFEAATNSILMKTLGISDAWKTTFLGSLSVVRQLGVGEEAAQRFKQALQGAMVNLGPSMLEKVAESTVRLAKAQDEARAAYVASTGQADENIMSLIENQRQYSFAGVSARSYGEALTSLTSNMGIFNTLSDTQKNALTANVAMLNRLGISSDLASKTHASLTMRFKMSTEESQKQIRSFVALSGAGITAAEATDGYNQSLSTLIKYGKESIPVYKEMIVAAKMLQTDTATLINTMSQFDTFESAATAVGKLNAVMGGDYLNSVDFMNATESQRIEMLIKMREESGKSWESMNKFEKQAIANAAGISDMTVATSIFSQNLREYQKEQNKAKNAGMSEKELRDRAKATQTLSEDFQSMMESFALSMSGVITAGKTVAGWFEKTNNVILEFSNNTFGLGTVIAGVMGIIGVTSSIAMGKFVVSTGAKMAATVADTAASYAAAAANTTLAASATTAGTAATGAVAPMLGLAAAGLGIGLGIGAAAYGLSMLADSFSKLGDSQMAGVIATMSLLPIAILTIGITSQIAGPGLLLLGAAALGIGAGMGLAAAGTSLLVNSLSNLPIETMEAVGLLAAKLALLGPVAPLMGATALGLTAVSVAFAAMGLSLKTFDQKALESISSLMTAISELKPEVVVRFKSVTDGLVDVFDKASDVAENGGSDALENMTKVASSTASGGSGGSSQINVTLELDKKVLESVVVDIINNKARVRKNN